MYADQLRTLTRAYKSAQQNNKVYNEAKQKVNLMRSQMDFLIGLQSQLKSFDLAVTEQENIWRQGVLGVLEAEIMDALSFVYPTDGYKVQLSSRILRGRIHIEAKVLSVFSGNIPGSISGTQGRLFQQVVSSSSLVAVMNLLGIKTIYIDEAFSGSSKRNVQVLNKWLQSLKDRGFNVILIAQDKSIADGIEANRLILTRSLDNQTSVWQEGDSNE